MSGVDFTAHRHPVLAVACPACGARPGAWCQRPSEHKAADLHAVRGREADRLFVDMHGDLASIERTPNGWRIDPRGRSTDHQSAQADLFGERA